MVLMCYFMLYFCYSCKKHSAVVCHTDATCLLAQLQTCLIGTKEEPEIFLIVTFQFHATFSAGLMRNPAWVFFFFFKQELDSKSQNALLLNNNRDSARLDSVSRGDERDDARSSFSS